MQRGAANRVVCSANEVLYPVKWDHMFVEGARVCIIPRQKRDFCRSISQKPYMRELSFFTGIVYLNKLNESSSKGM